MLATRHLRRCDKSLNAAGQAQDRQARQERQDREHRQDRQNRQAGMQGGRGAGRHVRGEGRQAVRPSLACPGLAAKHSGDRSRHCNRLLRKLILGRPALSPPRPPGADEPIYFDFDSCETRRGRNIEVVVVTGCGAWASATATSAYRRSVLTTEHTHMMLRV